MSFKPNHKRPKTKLKSPEDDAYSKPGAAVTRRKLDKELIAAIVDLTLKGLPADTICDYLGIWQSTFYRWTTRGKQYIEANFTPAEDEIFGRLVVEIRRAFAGYKKRIITKMHKSRMWPREMTILDRRDRRNFGRYEQVSSNEDYSGDDKFL